MRTKSARIPPLEASDWTESAKQSMQPFIDAQSDFNIFKTLTNHPDLMRRWMVFANHVLFKSTLPFREKELLILRIGFLCQAGYEWGQHVQVARKGGVSDEDINLAKTGPDTPGITKADELLLTAVDELHNDAFISDATWSGLTEFFDTKQMMDLVFTVGQYNLVSMALNSFGVQLDDGLPGWEL
ncbi:MAG: carboxymuconolactone decarboxylase family protein [Pseudomonadota bacterium]